MLSGAIAYQVLQQESPQTKMKAVLKKHPWYRNQWQARVQDVPIADHGLVLFVQALKPALFLYKVSRFVVKRSALCGFFFNRQYFSQRREVENNDVTWSRTGTRKTIRDLPERGR